MQDAATSFNLRLIPLLCRKAGVPLADARGRITSHRARATIATQLYNAKEPMTLFELRQIFGLHEGLGPELGQLDHCPQAVFGSFR